MKQKDALSIDQVEVVLDNAPVAVYVSTVDTWELLYVNKAAKNLIMQNVESGALTCYQAAGFHAPCPFCRAKEMDDSALLTREFQHPGNGRVYQLSGKLIDWGGRTAHIEYILDITSKKKEEERDRALKEELQATFCGIPCGLCVYRFDGKQISPLFHNPAFYQIMGYSEAHIQALEQQTNFLGVHPEDVGTLAQKIQEAIEENCVMQDTYRVWNDQEDAYHWIHLEGSVKSQQDGTKLLYGVYSDVSEHMQLEKELTAANEKMQDIINAIPGGVAIYKVSNIFETKYFSDGVPELTGYTVEEYRELTKGDAMELIYWEDIAMVVSNVQKVIETHEIAKLEFRKQHRDGHIVWVRAQAKWIGEEDGCPLLHCVFHNISEAKEAQLEMDHLINSIPGGIASYRVEGDRFIPTFFSDGVSALTGHTREEYEKIIQNDALNVIYEPDRERVLKAAKTALINGTVMDVSYRMRHKDGNLIWLHLNGRRMGPLTENTKFYVVFTGMSAETRLFQSIANETADGIYVIDKQNFDILYVNESKKLFTRGGDHTGQKCYQVLHGREQPCSFCTLGSHQPDGEEHEMAIDGTDRFYSTRFRETDWNGIPAYVKYIRDITEEVNTRKEKERLEQYFQTLVKNLPGGVAVVRYQQDGSMVPEFLSDGFAQMTGMTLEEAWRVYQHNAMDGVHPEDLQFVNEQMAACVANKESHCEIVYRLKKGDHSFMWVKNTLSLIQNKDGERSVYCVYQDMTKEQEKQEQLRRQYNDLILQHYRAPGPNALVVGHCNITQNRILEIIDYTDSDLLKTFGSVREEFFTGISSLVVEEAERQTFLNTYLNAPALAAFENDETEQVLECYIKLPQEAHGRYARFHMNLVATPDSGDVTGILTVTDITEQTISDRILHQLSISNYDFVVDLNLEKDSYSILSCNKKANCVPEQRGGHSQRMAYMLRSVIVPKDKERYAKALQPDEIRRRMQKEGAYTFAFSVLDEEGDIRTKNMTVSAVDLRLGRVCLVRTDITDSVREQQGLLNMIAYTFELAGFLNVNSDSFVMYTRETVLKNLAPRVVERYHRAVEDFPELYGAQKDSEQAYKQFCVDTMLRRLAEKPEGYDFVFLYQADDGPRYKQVNVLWGDENHRTICLVRADVTDMLAAERQTKNALEKALALAEEANRAKSDFLSAMSHDIRTPMNAIMGMTALAFAHLDDRGRVEDCLQKISISSKHLLSLINDVLDMSKIECSKITLNQVKVSLSTLVEQLSAMMGPQARDAGLNFEVKLDDMRHTCFYGDSLRINQILINLLSNAIKFTPEGGTVRFEVEEIPALEDAGTVRYRFTIRDTGIGMSEEFLAHIFEPFSRSRDAATIEGTGLGLSVTKGLVDLMGGVLSVKSQVRRGSVFQVELECKEARPEDSGQVEEVNQSASHLEIGSLFAGRRFLVAEDNAINAEILCELLAMHGAKTTVRTDGIKAVKAFQNAAPGTYDAILMDIQMPGMNGYEATRAIREMQRPDAQCVPIIAMTANAFAEDVQASLNAGMTAHVAKPIDVDLLRETLAKVLKEHRIT